MEPLLTEREAAKLLNMTAEGLRGLRKRREGPRVIRVGRLVRYMEKDVEEWAEASAARS